MDETEEITTSHTTSSKRSPGFLQWAPAIVVALSLVGNIVALGRSMQSLDDLEKRVSKIETYIEKESQDFQAHLIAQARTEEQYKSIIDRLQDMKNTQDKFEKEMREAHGGRGH